MSFQAFRIHLPAPQQTYNELDGSSPASMGPMSNDPTGASGVHSPPATYTENPRKGLYGSGEADERYTLVFESIEAFEAWRQREEEEKMVEFVKGDTHSSKAVPPRFKEHTKLVCGRHSRGGRKKYVKKYPDRVRKVPSRKLEGVGCPASISYKTYFDSNEVRACYISEHSHEIGPANLPYTKRGRKAQAQMEARTASERPRGRPRKDRQSETPSASPSSASFMDNMQAQSPMAGPSTASTSASMNQAMSSSPEVHTPQQTFQSAISMLAPLPSAGQMQQPPVDINQDRWDRMGVLFQSIRDHARTFEFPVPSVAALESVLIRLYLESPIGGGGGSAPAGPPIDPMLGGTGMNGQSMDANHHGSGGA
ncbi:hypothetical protein PYCCODRAFT_1434621 [Trametes coccinea BRFM310]|uniref:Uncharacterized protein n=1 Tax=Trametes coccinea (strain BRFM310) TaxID=1353009 RepID=A0A1Y2IR95_TRAC3|nr:hypothetical protein PYCCODRAFT_1434621 [Trametes coccinea BRFM310]